ncbi:MAG: cytochrome c-type biogenesis protein CcmH [Actinomycetota bacterium]
MRTLAVVMLGLAGSLLMSPAIAAPEDVANDISNQIMSPYCPGVTLHDCPSDAAARLRSHIVGWAEEGMSRAEIMQRLEDEFGPSIRATPPSRGTGLLAWILPIGAIGAGLVTALLLVSRWKRRAAPGQATVSPEDRERVELALQAYRSRT